MSTGKPKTASPSFTDLFLPRHSGSLELAKVMSPSGMTFPTVKQLAIASLAPPDVAPKPKSLIDFYMGNDLRPLYDDTRARPDHYDDRQKQVIEHLMYNAALAEPVTDKERDDLFLQYVRNEQVAKATKDKIRDLTGARHKQEQAENDAIVMEDGRTFSDHLKAEEPGGSFEKQDFGDKIII